MTTEEAEVQMPPQSHPPLLAHWRFPDETTALCGKKLIGIPAPPDSATCVVCESMRSSMWW